MTVYTAGHYTLLKKLVVLYKEKIENAYKKRKNENFEKLKKMRFFFFLHVPRITQPKN